MQYRTRYGIRGLFDGLSERTPTLTVVNRTAPRQVQRILTSLFTNQPVHVRERHQPNGPQNLVQLTDGDRLVAVSPLDDLADAVLLVNSDRYRTDEGMGGPRAFPDVLANLDEIPFTLRGYPEAHQEKLLFVGVARLIERTAYDTTDGTLRASLQDVSQLSDDRGTRTLYAQLVNRPIDVDLYGCGSEIPTEFEGHLTVGDRWPHRRCWCVSYRNRSYAAALVSVEARDNTWIGYWTFDPDRVDRVNAWIDEHLRP